MHMISKKDLSDAEMDTLTTSKSPTTVLTANGKVLLQHTSKTGSSSCQRTTTFHAEEKEIQKDVNTIHRQLRNMLVKSRAVIGPSWGLNQKRNGAELTPTNPTDPVTEWQRI